ncbi:hypothetical protein ZEAMMB73_Zm00001d005171 [Zea mays]|uniref:Uncharacterized protein n=1 Tax=Zea mays TaxID=4577 RepID=A0A1D6EKX1_MAIZE|nr:hypothetical protein ZEAMMB73_Zm00001d005171 [Zea mays]
MSPSSRLLAWCFLFGDTCTSKFGDLLLKSRFCKEVILTDRSDEVLAASVVVMTKADPSIERDDLILLQEIAMYMLLACGAIYVISIRKIK